MVCPNCRKENYRDLHTRIVEDGEQKWVYRCNICKSTFTKKIRRLSMSPRDGVSFAVIQYSDGEAIARYESIRKASEVTGIAQSSICRCCHGQQKTAGGFAWGYDRRKLFTEDKEIER